MAWPDTPVVDASPVVGSSAESEPAMRAVPGKGPSNAFAQGHARLETDLGARARDVERAALREEVHATAEDGRLDPQRDADGLAGGAGDPDRPDRQVTRGCRYACPFRHQPYERVERGHLPARQDV